MIIQLQGATAENVEAARQNLEALTHSWGQGLAEAPAKKPEVAGPARDDDKVIDPISLAALIVSIPSAVLAAADLADRIQKRHRAKELIDQAEQLAVQQVTVSLISQNNRVELNTLTPDQLLDLLAEENRTN
jgi:hypothetical protein